MLNCCLRLDSKQQRQSVTIKRQGFQQKHPSSLCYLAILFIMMLSSLRHCRASRFLLRPSKQQQLMAFVGGAPTNAARLSTDVATTRLSFFSSHARLQYNDNDNGDMDVQRQNVPTRRRPPPPPRARRLPPTLESSMYDGESNINPEFPDVHVSPPPSEETYDIYDPSAPNTQAYGFYTNQQRNGATDGRVVKDEQNGMKGGSKQAILHDETNQKEYGGVVNKQPPMVDPYYNNKQEELVSNPHNYWDNDDDTSSSTTDDETPSKMEATAVSIQDDKVKEEEEKVIVEESIKSPNQQVKATISPPPASTSSNMPPRSEFASSPPNDDHRNDVYVQASSGNAITSEVEMLAAQLNRIEQDVYTQNNNEEFNIKSTKQVSMVLFGQPGLPTNKEKLEAMGGAGNAMADLILQYRSLARKISRLKKKKENKDNGTLVKNVSASARPPPNNAKATAKEGSKNAEVEANVNDEEEVLVEGDPLLLVDASAYIYRAYYSMPIMHRRDGMPVGAVLGFCNMLNRLVLSQMLEGECPRLVLVFDAKGKTFRHELYDEYKANRKACPMDLIPQFDLIRQAAKAYGIQQVEAPNFEADDVIATLATMALKEGVDANILSGDKDLMQLITPQDEFPSIQMVDPMTRARVSHDVVVSKWGVTPDKLGDVLALAGDSADNIPGVPGIGPKIAAMLIEEYGSLEELLEQVDNVKQKKRREKLKDNMENARLSRELVELVRELPLDKMTFPENVLNAAELRMAPMDKDRLLAFYDDMGFKDIKRRVEERLDKKKAVRKSKKYNNRRQKAEIPTPEDYKDVPF